MDGRPRGWATEREDGWAIEWEGGWMFVRREGGWVVGRPRKNGWAGDQVVAIR